MSDAFPPSSAYEGALIKPDLTLDIGRLSFDIDFVWALFGCCGSMHHITQAKRQTLNA